MALAAGADTHKMKYGHRGGNHPVKDLKTGRVYISSQNHGYVVDTDRLDPAIAVPAFINVNDGTNEGLSYIGKRTSLRFSFTRKPVRDRRIPVTCLTGFMEMMGGTK